jgi:hypothetical protein
MLGEIQLTASSALTGLPGQALSAPGTPQMILSSSAMVASE